MNILLKNSNINLINVNIISNNYLFFYYKESFNIIGFNKHSVKKLKYNLDIINFNNIKFINLICLTNSIFFSYYDFLFKYFSNNVIKYYKFIIFNYINLKINVILIKHIYILIKYYNKIKSLNVFIINKYKYFIFTNIYIHISKLKIKGRGWKIVKKFYTILYKIGYSHSFYMELNPSLILLKKKKKKKYYRFYSNNKQNLIFLVNNLAKKRNLDKYSGKGSGYIYKKI